MKSDLVTIPITEKFDGNNVIGSLTIRRDALPDTPGFVFALAYRALQATGLAPGELPHEPYIGRYELVSVAPTSDESYLEYLKQIGVA